MTDTRSHSTQEQYILSLIAAEIARIFDRPKDSLDINASFLALGIDSILGMDLLEAIGKPLGVTLGPELIFDYRTPGELAHYIAGSFTIGPQNQAEEKKNDLPPPPVPLPTGLEDIAVIGMSARFADSDNPGEYWNHLHQGHCCIREIRRPGFAPAGHNGTAPGTNNGSTGKWAGLLTDIDRFDPLFFSISPREARRMDPQQRLFLEESYKALEDGGYPPESLSGKNVGVFVGARGMDYKEYALAREEINSQIFLGNDMAILSGRISYHFNFKGPNVQVDAACSSSLLAVHLAVESIRQGECDLALAGGVFLLPTSQFYLLAASAAMLSPDGRCRAFDSAAGGMVIGEGVAAVVLKPLSRALKDRDHIYGIIKASVISHNGSTQGITAPSTLPQTELISRAYRQSGIDPKTIGYVEIQGTGTLIGDAIEFKALSEAFRAFTNERQFCAIGSHAPNIGHAMAAAGMAGLIKVLLCLEYKKIPPFIGIEQLNPNIHLDNSPFYINTSLKSWDCGGGQPRRAGLGTFAFNGSNSYLVLEEPPACPDPDEYRGYCVFPLSARSDKALDRRIQDLTAWLDREGKNYRPVDIAYTLQLGRTHFSRRLAFIAKDIDELRRQLTQKGNSQANADIPADLPALTRAYTAGENPDWSVLYAADPSLPCRIPLPAYPFDRERYWLDEAPGTPVTGPAGPHPADSSLHPDIPTTAHSLPGLEAIISENVASVLEIAPGQIDPGVPYTALGVNSLLSVEIINRINDRLGIRLRPTDLFNYANVERLTTHILETFGPDIIHAPRERTAARETAHLEQRRVNRADDEHIAVIGMSARFPDAPSVEHFWQNLAAGRNSIREITRWDMGDIYDPHPQTMGKSISKWGAFLDDISNFDAAFFNISPREAEVMDPQQRLFLEEAWRVLEDAGYSDRFLDGCRCGVFIGCLPSDYSKMLVQGGQIPDAYSLLGNSESILTARISYLLNLKGPSIPVDTACSASLVALHLACESIRSGQCDLAISGGVYLITGPDFYIQASSAGMLAPDGQCKTFDQRADGFVPGEGIGLVVLKNLEAARRDGDHIYGIIIASGINQDGRTNGITAPSAPSQTALECEVYEKFAIDPETITFIEAHGSGTKLGDPIEIDALTDAFRQYTAKKQYCAVGSVKTNIGHTVATAGIAGFIKVLLCLKNKRLVPSLNLEKENEFIDFASSPFYVNTRLEDWQPGPGIPRVAAVSSFGFSGTNAHVVVKEAESIPQELPLTAAMEPSAYLITLSAHNETALKQRAQDLLDFLKRQNSKGTVIPIRNISFPLLVGRSHFSNRLALVVQGMPELEDKLGEYLYRTGSPSHCFTGSTSPKTHPALQEKAQKVLHDLVEMQQQQRAGEDVYREKLCTLAELYSRGGDAQWELLFTGQPCRRLPLPTYPFAGDSYWIPGMPIDRLMVFQPQWQESPLDRQSPGLDLADGEVLLLFDSDERLRQDFRRHGSTVILVKPGTAFGQAQADVYRVRPGQAADYRDLIASLKGRRLLPTRIVHRWSAGGLTTDPGILGAQLERSIYSLFHLSQALMTLKAVPSVHLLYVYPSENNDLPPQFAAISGFSRSLTRENPHFLYRTLAIEGTCTPEILLAEFAAGQPGEVEVQYRQGQRLVRHYREVKTGARYDHEALPFKEGGVYLITGGTGSLALQFAGYLARHVRARLVLADIYEPGPEKQSQLQAIKDLGAEILVVIGDIACRSDVANMVHQAREKFKEINGVIHCAGVSRASFLLNKSQEDMDNVLAPKVYGTLWLDEATREDNLDFFVMFASIAGAFGNQGQCDYAYANNFMDYFAQTRSRQNRSGKTLAIDWPLWKNSGIIIPGPQRRLFLEETGLSLLPTAVGIKALEDMLHLGLPRCTLLYGGHNARRYFIDPRPAPDPKAREITRQSLPTAGPDLSRLEEKTGRFLRDIFSELLRMPPENIDPGRNFQEFGIDSIMIHQFNTRIERDLGPIPRTLLFEHHTLQELIRYLVEHHGPALADFFHEKQTIPSSPGNTRSDMDIAPVPVRPVFTPALTENVQPAGDIAIIGLAGRYPQAENIDQFWENLKTGKDCVREVPANRWDSRLYFHPDPEKSAEGKMYCKWGGYLSEVDRFDPLFFNISPREAETMDPQERMFLETAWEALEDAGYSRKRLLDFSSRRGKNWAEVGVFAAATAFTYQFLGPDLWRRGNMTIPNALPWSIANRVSYVLDIHGPSLPVDTACSSSLTALHLACESLKRGECELAIAGGVNLYLHPMRIVWMCQMRMLSFSGHCHTFGRRGDGFVPGEGVGAVVLKPLTRALQDRDTIYAVIKGSAINHGGTTNGYTVPNPMAQADVIVKALRRAGIDGRTIGYIEAHGTGTVLGDPIEIAGIDKAFREFTADKHFCSIGSIKSNIGHLESAAGIAGITKIILQMKHRRLVPSLHCTPPNPNIDFTQSPVFIQEELTEWKSPVIPGEGGDIACPRRAGISSFGAGGANAHVILEEFPPAPPAAPLPLHLQGENPHDEEPRLFLLSAKNEERLKVYARRMLDFLAKKTGNHDQGGDEKPGEPHSRQQIEAELLDAISATRKVDKGSLDIDEDWHSYGLDPVDLAAILQRLNEKYGLHLTLEHGSDMNSILSLARYIYRECQKTDTGSPASPLSLADITYTLQVGREALDVRLALIVSSVDELTGKLERFCLEKDGKIENLFYGNTKNEREKSRLIRGRAGKEFIRIVMEEKDLQQLARLWVAGVDIEWQPLYGERPPRCISLPTYPFRKDRCWLPDAGEGPEPAGTPFRHTAKLHPLIDANTSTLKEQRFTSRFSGREFFLADHVVAGQKTLPGVVYLEMARAGGELAGEARVEKMAGILWARPILQNSDPLDVYITFYPGGDGSAVTYDISTHDGNNERVLHSSGKLVYESAAQNHDGNGHIDLETIKNRCPQRYGSDECYRLFREMGLEYGASFQPVKEVYSNGREALARLELPAGLEGEEQRFYLHPSLTDGALQTLIGLLGEEEITRPWVPFSLGELELRGPLPRQCYAHAVLLEPAEKRENAAGPGVKRFDILLLDPAGEVLVGMKNFSARSIPLGASWGVQAAASQTTVSAIPPTSSTIMYCQGCWQESSPLPDTGNIADSAPLLVFAGDDRLKAAISKKYTTAIWVKPGPGFKKIDDFVYEIDPREQGDYLQLLESLNQRQILPHRIVFTWSPAKQESAMSRENLEERLDKGIYSVFHLCKAILEKKIREFVQVIYLYSAPDPGAPPLDAAVQGFARSLYLENPMLRLKTVEMNRQAEARVADIMAREFDDGAQYQWPIRYEDDRRFEHRLVEWPAGRPGEKSLPLKDGGVYLVTGGLGKLGLIFAGYLAGKVRARLVLTDLVDPSLSIVKERIDALEHLGAEVLYVKADISIKPEVETLIDRARSRFQHIDGIIHGAGVIRDALLVKKTKEQMAAVLSPKIFGTIWLDEATQEEPLEFFVLFSSLTGVMGNLGQSDYAYANCFMDSFAEDRERARVRGERHGTTQAIDWPLWREGGMNVDKQTETWMEKRFGLAVLETTAGISAFETILAAGLNRTIVAPGNRDKILAQLGGPPVPAAGTGSAQGMATVEKELVKLCSELLKVRENEMDPGEELGSYGLDSIMMMTMLNRLEAMYGRVIEPNVLVEHNTIARLAAYLIGQGITGTRKEEATGPKPGFVTVASPAGRFSPRQKPASRQKIAVIGLACRFPRSGSPELFWENLENGRDLIREVPGERWKIEDYFSPDKRKANKTYSRWAGLIDNIYAFDATYFGISDQDAQVMDPQHRIFLELTEELRCRAGYTRQDLDSTRTAVYIGGGESPYVRKNVAEIPGDSQKHLLINTIQNMMAARISDFYNLKGTSQIIDTACSSSLVALHQACRDLRSGECAMAIVGGCELLIGPYLHLAFSQAEVLSDDGVSRIFDERANGFVLGEGLGVVLLKPYEDALRDGDHVLAVILGSAANNDGHTMGLTVPSLEGQKDVIKKALENSRVGVDSIAYLEAHGTGTLLGDPIEIRAATQVFREFSQRKQFCAVGSVKSNMGHLMRAAGIASFIKVILALDHRIIPPTLHCTTPHPRFQFENSPFYPITAAKAWQPHEGTRRAAISSFGFGGTNCHMILEESGREATANPQRPGLPLPHFKHKHYCLGQPIMAYPGMDPHFDGTSLMRLLSGLHSGQIDIDKASMLMKDIMKNT